MTDDLLTAGNLSTREDNGMELKKLSLVLTGGSISALEEVVCGIES